MRKLERFPRGIGALDASKSFLKRELFLWCSMRKLERFPRRIGALDASKSFLKRELFLWNKIKYFGVWGSFLKIREF
jgi:hypothetical protein